uniref:Uncharacterized protein n=1 Tax=Micromonas pusilla TaxID=38833 RepID=A0A7S0PME9_MICPS|mmetsp:Transcript_15191/g.59384  ORF Transcript_15191/g.59384 Transcript_15191/m.59384 type:complete len:211 (+) Transcript_15191:90-722(+)
MTRVALTLAWTALDGAHRLPRNPKLKWRGRVLTNTKEVSLQKVREPRSSRLTATENDEQDRRLPGTDDLSTSFSKELKRRKRALQGGENDGADFGGKELPKAEEQPRPVFRDDRNPSRGIGNQLKVSRDLQNDGLAGFPSRTSELLTLGLTVFFSFGPIIAVCSVFFVVTYLLLGSDFIHGGDQDTTTPSYVTPQSLLYERDIDGKLEKR